MCVCIYIHTHIERDAYIHTQIHIHIHTSGVPDAVSALVEGGASCLETNAKGDTPLFTAAIGGQEVGVHVCMYICM